MQETNTTARERISVEEAEAIISSHVVDFGEERCTLQAAAGRVLRAPVSADRDLPPFDRVTMDGIAIRYSAYQAGRREFTVAGTQAAGAPPMQLEAEAGCIEVMTGASLPSGTDCVVPVELIALSDGTARLSPDAQPSSFGNVHRRGSDYPEGTVLMQQGARLAPAHIAICASVGLAEVAVSALPRVAVAATGDELVPVTSRPLAHQIRISNSYEVAAALVEHDYPAPTQYHLPDDMSSMIDTLGNVLENYDVLVLSGGVSAGKFDLVPAALERLGVTEHFHRVRQRPGLPLWFGTGPKGQAVFGLPGNPVSTLVSTRRYVIPYLDACQRRSPAPQFAALAEAVEFEPELTYFLPVSVRSDRSAAALTASPRPVHGSGDFARLTESDGFVELPASQSRFPEGSVWRFYRWGNQ